MRQVVLVSLSLLFFSGIQLQAQDLISSAGATFEGTSGSISWSLGEPVTLTLSGTNGQLTQGFQQPNTEIVVVDAGTSQTICQTKALLLADLDPILLPPTVAGTWSTSGTGVFDDTNSQTGVFGQATTYTPSAQDAMTGEVLLTLTAEVGLEDSVVIYVLKADCGSFPWNGNE